MSKSFVLPLDEAIGALSSAPFAAPMPSSRGANLTRLAVKVEEDGRILVAASLEDIVPIVTDGFVEVLSLGRTKVSQAFMKWDEIVLALVQAKRLNGDEIHPSETLVGAICKLASLLCRSGTNLCFLAARASELGGRLVGGWMEHIEGKWSWVLDVTDTIKIVDFSFRADGCFIVANDSVWKIPCSLLLLALHRSCGIHPPVSGAIAISKTGRLLPPAEGREGVAFYESVAKLTIRTTQDGGLEVKPGEGMWLGGSSTCSPTLVVTEIVDDRKVLKRLLTPSIVS